MKSKFNLRSFNLNTLPVLWEILRQGGVGNAAKALHVSQPALSAALKQLRTQFDDELIFRANGTMKLTPTAEALLAPLEKALEAVQDLIAPDAGQDFENKIFLKIGGSDCQMEAFGAPVVKSLSNKNIGVIPVFLSINSESAQQLSDGEIDCLIVPKSIMLDHHLKGSETKALKSAPLFSEAMVGIASGDDSTIAKGLTLQGYLDRPHVSFAVDPFRNLAIEQAFLASNNFLQNDIARFSSFSALLPIVETTDCISLVPSGFAKAAMKRYDIQTFVPPIDFPSFDWVMVWHQRTEQEPRFAQFRGILESIALQADEAAAN